MSRESGEPSGFHENEVPKKETASSEKKRGSIFEFIRKKMPVLESREERPPEVSYETENSEEDDEEESIGGRWLKALQKKFKGEVAYKPVSAGESKPESTDDTTPEDDTGARSSSLASIFLSEPTPVAAQADLFNEEPMAAASGEAEGPLINSNDAIENQPGENTERDAPIQEHAHIPEQANISIVEEGGAEAPLVAEIDPTVHEEDEETTELLMQNAAYGSGAMSNIMNRTPLPNANLDTVTPEKNPIDATSSGRNAAVPLLGLGLAYEHHRVTKLRRENEKLHKEGEQEAKAQAEKIRQLQFEQQRQAALQFERNAEVARMAAIPSSEKQAESPVGVERPKAEAPAPRDEQAEKPTPAVAEVKPLQASGEQQKEEVKTSLEKKPEKAPSVGEIIAERSPIPAEKLEKKVAPKLPEIPEVSKVTYLNPEELLRPDFQGKSSELVLQQVEAAAEQDIALESQYELRHEVKDVATGPTQGGSTAYAAGRTPVSGLSNDSHELAQSMAAAAFQSDSHQADQDKDRKNPLAPSYKQAMKSGVWGAVVILVAIGIWALSS